jgi:hypothetical protein
MTFTRPPKSIKNVHLGPWVTARYARERRNSATKIGELVMGVPRSPLSQFGDTGIFFKHQRYEDR